jgi:hypothetical protein
VHLDILKKKKKKCEKRKPVDTTLCCVIHVCLIEVPREAAPLEEFFNETIEHTSLI